MSLLPLAYLAGEKTKKLELTDKNKFNILWKVILTPPLNVK